MKTNVYAIMLFSILSIGLGAGSVLAQTTNSSSTSAGSPTVTIAAGTGAAGANGACATAKNCFNPGNIQVTSGANVTWKNNDNVIHTVTSGKSTDSQFGTLFDKSINPGQSISMTFNNGTGVVNYFCKVHPWMSGQVTVS